MYSIPKVNQLGSKLKSQLWS